MVCAVLLYNRFVPPYGLVVLKISMGYTLCTLGYTQGQLTEKHWLSRNGLQLCTLRIILRQCGCGVS